MTPFAVSSDARHLAQRCFDDTLPAIDRLLYAASLQSYLNDAMQALAAVARSEEGHSWADVGEALSITKQAAHQRLHASSPALNDAGDYRDQPPSTYVAALRQAADEVRKEGGRERDLRLIEAGIAHYSGQPVSPEQQRQSLLDARAALLEQGSREADLALLDAVLAGEGNATVTPVPVDWNVPPST